ncbi:MAG: YaiI/YqxD family protein [Alphaproteobacteria bacterium]|nr:YaiI/YqxD family protein [Alphaproteobacteria bacterium]
MTDSPEPKPIEVFVDADACPVKEEVYRVARRYGLKVYVVANGSVRVPREPLIELIAVEQGPDIADDWIAAHAESGDIVVTADIPLAHRCLQKCAEVVGPTGRPFTTNSIGAALAQRGIMEHLRSSGEITGGPKPFAPADRSRFLAALDEAINRSRRKRQTP